jgi:hypothetical protein
MFQLVQRGMPLTPAEKMRALSTKWAVFAKQYEEDYAMVVNCKCKICRVICRGCALTLLQYLSRHEHLDFDQ